MRRLGRQSGFTLLELLLVIPIAAMLLVLTIGWIHQTLQFSSSLRQRQANHQNMMRIKSDLRDDVHASQRMSLQNENQLSLELTNQAQVKYTISGSTLTVEKRHPNSNVRKEVFNFPTREIRWALDEETDQVSLIVSRLPISRLPLTKPSDNATSAFERGPIELQVSATPGRWGASRVEFGPSRFHTNQPEENQ